jgi:hypothetical protein
MNRWKLGLLGLCVANRQVLIAAIHSNEVEYEVHILYVAVKVMKCASDFVSSEKLSEH